MMKNKYKVMLISCWIILALCCVAKLFGADWFTAHTDNETFLSFCRYVENSFWFYILTITFNIITSSIYFMAVFKQKKPNLKWFIPLFIYAIIKSIFYKQKILFFILDIVFMVGYPILLNYRCWIRTIVMFIATFAFQYISMFLKLDNYKIFSENAFVSMILSIDYVIMLILAWLHIISYNKGGKVSWEHGDGCSLENKTLS